MSKPNVVFILADDLGYVDLSSYGRRDYETPHLDALANSGIKLTHGYSNSPVCSATRVSLITGQYQYRYPLGLHEPLSNASFDVEDKYNSPDQRADRFTPLPTDIDTLPREFQKRGYSTHLVGKWHLGRLPDNGPRSYGYDTFFGFLGGATDYFRHRMFLDEDRSTDGLIVNDELVEREGYLTNLLGEDTEKIIKDHKEGEKPFFISLHFNAPHWPWEGPNDEHLSKDLRSLLGLEGNIRKYGEIVKAMDDQVGKVVQTLKETGQFDNTIIVFTSDNGGERFGDTWPFLGYKTELLEGGLRVPLILSWPDGFQSGIESEQVLTSMDFYPTLLGAVDQSYEEYKDRDGVNLFKVFKKGEKHELVKRKLFWRYKANHQKAVLDGPWKYIKISDREALFNIEYDERERTDFKQKHPEIFERLKAEYDEWNSHQLDYPDWVKSIPLKPQFIDRY